MQVQNMTNSNYNTVPNQFIIEDKGNKYFQSYTTMIVKINTKGKVFLDRDAWDYSKTTSKYRNLFLGDDTKTVKARIKSGEYILKDLNK